MAEEKQPLKQRIRTFLPKIPDVGQITEMMDQRFGTLIQKLDEMLVELRRMNEKMGPK